LASLVATLTDEQRRATGTGHGLALPRRVSRVLAAPPRRSVAASGKSAWPSWSPAE
jgi:hypothetical protein